MEFNDVKTYRDLYLIEDETSDATKDQAQSMPWFLGEDFVAALGIYDAEISIGKPVRGLFLKKNRCPQCKSTEYSKNGFNSRGIARRKCKKCGKSYIAENKLNTGNNILNSRKKAEDWMQFIEVMLDYENEVRKSKLISDSDEEKSKLKSWMFKAAEFCGLNIKTAYDWKNRTKASLKKVKESVDGEMISDDNWYNEFLECYDEVVSYDLKNQMEESSGRKSEFVRNTFLSLFIAEEL